MRTDPELRAHHEWLGYLQPVGLVVSPPALAAAECHVNRNIVHEQQTLLRLVNQGPPAVLRDLPGLCRELLGWEAADLAGIADGPELPRTLDVSLAEYGEVLSPTYAVPDPEHSGQWLMLVKALPRTLGLDVIETDRQDGSRWHASPHARFERLLRENGVPVGLLWNGTHLRLVYAPRGESSGHLTFPIDAMCEVAGRPILSALHMLLSAERLFTVPTKQRLPAILAESRKYQNVVSTRLAEQVLAALHELLRGFQAADQATKGELLREVLRQAPQEVYGGLLGTLMRLVFILYAEDRGLLPAADPVYQQHYSVTGLFERLRDHAARYPDTMDQRHGAWAQLLTLFRLIHDGAAHDSFRLPPRHGRLFDPDTWDFLEGRPYEDDLDRTQHLDVPRVSDGVVYRVLDNLLMLDGDRISYRALDVEQVGSVYEAMMGFELRIARGTSIAVRPDHVVVDLEGLLAAKPAERKKRLKDEAGCQLSGAALQALSAASTSQDVVAALGRKVSRFTPSPLPPGATFLQPTDERRRSGSHYTPRSLTEPIVRTTLEPILKNLGESPRPDQILDLKVCDPAMGSGAFLVEACRYLGDALVAAWEAHGETPPIPPDEDPVLFARRQVAQRCLYGVDKNPYAVDLAKLSLWLATLARDHPFTFLDHALRHGDSLVGLTREQIASFHWQPDAQVPIVRRFLDTALREVEERRAALFALGDSDDHQAKARLHREAVHALGQVHDAGDLAIAAFFGAGKPKDRERLRLVYRDQLQGTLDGTGDPQKLRDIVDGLYRGPQPVPPFHWEIEFPEVFSRENPGFDAFVGNPPFLGGKRISTVHGDAYRDWLAAIHEASSSNADLVAHFYRRVFDKIRRRGTLGLVATNTIAQGDTRGSGLRWLCQHDGVIYSATRRVKWPGQAAVVVSVVHVSKDRPPPARLLDGRPVERITAFLFHDGGHEDPARLSANAGRSFIGSFVNGMGFTFDDTNPDATPIAEMERLIAQDPRNGERIFPYIGGEEVNDSPMHAHRRYVINFRDMTEAEARRWPDLMAIVEAKVRPVRAVVKRAAHRERWWHYGDKRPALYDAICGVDRVLVCTLHSPHLSFAMLTPRVVFSHALAAFALGTPTAFAALQARPHEFWARFLGSSIKDDLRYTPSDCFETFPFPKDWETNARLEETGKTYYDFRAALMVRNNEGLTKSYNRFHDPDEHDPEILKLRELHETMDRAVLDAYGWTDIHPRCEFLLDYEEDEDEDEAPRRRKKPWRYCWPDETRDEVLARLLALNQQRAKEEAQSGATADMARPTKGTRGRKRRPKTSGTLFDA